MLTIFTAPKPFVGHIGLIQRQALGSWCRLKPDVEVLVLGDEPGAAQAAAEFGARHHPNVETNERGTPLIGSIFRTAESLASYDTMCYANADIVFFADLIRSVSRVRFGKFLMVGRRQDLEVTELFDPADLEWESRFRSLLKDKGKWHDPSGLDYFVYRKDTLGEIPPFVVGRPKWDNWLMRHVADRGIPIIDASAGITALHQNHDYSHVGGLAEARNGSEAERNRELAGDRSGLLFTDDAGWVLGPRGLRRRWIPGRVRRRWRRRVAALVNGPRRMLGGPAAPSTTPAPPQGRSGG